MSGVIQALEIFLPLSYALILGVYLREFFNAESRTSRFWGSPLLYGALAIHLGYLVIHSIHAHHFPVSTRAEFLSLVALSIGLVYAFAERKHHEAKTGIFFIPLMVIAQSWSSLLSEPPATHPLLHEHPVYAIHVIFTVFGFSALAVSAIYALMYILLSRQLKSRNLGLIFRRLPPLATLENMGRLATLGGVILLAIGLATGHLLAANAVENFTLFDPKIIITYIAWALYTMSFLLAKIRRISGLRMGYLTVGGYLALISSMVVANTLFSSFHSFH